MCDIAKNNETEIGTHKKYFIVYYNFQVTKI